MVLSAMCILSRPIWGSTAAGSSCLGVNIHERTELMGRNWIKALPFLHPQNCHDIWMKTEIDHCFGFIFWISRVRLFVQTALPHYAKCLPRSRSGSIWTQVRQNVSVRGLHHTPHRPLWGLARSKRMRINPAEGPYSLNRQETMACMEGCD